MSRKKNSSKASSDKVANNVNAEEQVKDSQTKDSDVTCTTSESLESKSTTEESIKTMKESNKSSKDNEELKSKATQDECKDEAKCADAENEKDSSSEANDSCDKVASKEAKADKDDKSSDKSDKDEKSEEKSDQTDKSDDKKSDAKSEDKEKSEKEDKKDESKDDESKSSSDKADAKDEKKSDADKVEDNKDQKAKDSKDAEAAPKNPLSKTKKIIKKGMRALDNTVDRPVDEIFKAHIIVITSGKGGVGKTTTAAAISTGLALKGHKTCVIDFDVGLRNLDLIMGCERRVVFDLINVIHDEAKLSQALIKDKHSENLYILAASQTKDKDSLTYSGVGRVLKELSDMDFEYIICDSPAGIESGALIALYYADEAIVTTNPEVSSVRDSDRIIGILDAKSRRAEQGRDPVEHRLLLTRYVPSRVTSNEMLSIKDVQQILTIPLLGVIPESPDVLKASNIGETVILNNDSHAGQAYQDAVDRLLGEDRPLRFISEEQKNFWQKIFGSKK